MTNWLDPDFNFCTVGQGGGCSNSDYMPVSTTLGASCAGENCATNNCPDPYYANNRPAAPTISPTVAPSDDYIAGENITFNFSQTVNGMSDLGMIEQGANACQPEAYLHWAYYRAGNDSGGCADTPPNNANILIVKDDGNATTPAGSTDGRKLVRKGNTDTFTSHAIQNLGSGGDFTGYHNGTIAGSAEYFCAYTGVTSQSTIVDVNPASCISWSQPTQLLYPRKTCNTWIKPQVTLTAPSISSTYDDYTHLCAYNPVSFYLTANHVTPPNGMGVLDGSYQCAQTRQLKSYFIIQWKKSDNFPSSSEPRTSCASDPNCYESIHHIGDYTQNGDSTAWHAPDASQIVKAITPGGSNSTALLLTCGMQSQVTLALTRRLRTCWAMQVFTQHLVLSRESFGIM